jgi:hypothetical protein
MSVNLGDLERARLIDRLPGSARSLGVPLRRVAIAGAGIAAGAAISALVWEAVHRILG